MNVTIFQQRYAGTPKWPYRNMLFVQLPGMRRPVLSLTRGRSEKAGRREVAYHADVSPGECRLTRRVAPHATFACRAVRVGDTTSVVCDCVGFAVRGRCRHATAVRRLRDAGVLDGDFAVKGESK